MTPYTLLITYQAKKNAMSSYPPDQGISQINQEHNSDQCSALLTCLRVRSVQHICKMGEPSSARLDSGSGNY